MGVSRQPKGTPVGGEFATGAKAENTDLVGVIPGPRVRWTTSERKDGHLGYRVATDTETGDTCTLRDNGSFEFRNAEGEFHRLDGGPARCDGTEIGWYINGTPVAPYGPDSIAQIFPSGAVGFYRNGVNYIPSDPEHLQRLAEAGIHPRADGQMDSANLSDRYHYLRRDYCKEIGDDPWE